LVSLFVAGSAGLAVAAHHDGAVEADGASDFRVATSGGPTADQRAPGATDRSYWTEATTYTIPEGETVYLTETVTYRPIPSDCAPSDTDAFGVDRNGTYEGERRINDSATESVKSFSKDADARGEYERQYGPEGRLATTDWAYVERLRVAWYAPEDFGAPLELRHGDRFVSAQRGCLDNPDAAGWYRFASINTVELRNGTEITQDRPTFSHWFYVCDCGNREAAVETLGPPPSEDDDERDERVTATPTPGGESSPTATASDAGVPVDTEQGSPVGSPTADGTPTAATPIADPTGTRTAAPAGTPTADWDDRVIRTPTAADGSGFTPLAALLAALVAGPLLRRR
jgi:hypothetical protein